MRPLTALPPALPHPPFSSIPPHPPSPSHPHSHNTPLLSQHSPLTTLPLSLLYPFTEDPDSALRPLALFTVNLTHRRCVMDRAVFACPLCRVLASPRAYQQMVCNHAILHMSDEAATGEGHWGSWMNGYVERKIGGVWLQYHTMSHSHVTCLITYIGLCTLWIVYIGLCVSIHRRRPPFCMPVLPVSAGGALPDHPRTHRQQRGE